MRCAVIVDIDGTLIHSVEQDDVIYRQAVENILGEVRLRPTLSDYRRVTDTGILLDILDDNGISPSSSVLDNVKTEFVARIRRHIDEHGPFRPIPGAQEFIARLQAATTVGVAIATGGWRESAAIKLATAGFDTEGVPFATSDDASDRIEIMQIALNSLQGNFEQITYYGDGLWDRNACRELGWEFRAVGPRLAGIDNFDDEAGLFT